LTVAADCIRHARKADSTIMLIATTSLSDGIAIVAVATVLFMFLLGTVAFTRHVFRIICGRTAAQTVILVFPNSCEEKNGDSFREDEERLENFSWFLHAALRESKLGYLSEVWHDVEEIWVIFKGGDANQIWQKINTEAKDRAPGIPLRVILERARKNNGRHIIQCVEWTPTTICLPRPDLPAIPEACIRLSSYGRTFALLGIGGMSVWKFARMHLNLSENEFRDTALGNACAWFFGILLITGLSFILISSVWNRSLEKQAGFPTDDSSASSLLKYVLLLVVLIFLLILFSIVR
jgi:hypothetical protein